MIATLSTELQDKFANLQATLRGLGRVVVAFSGGVDSTLLLRAAIETLGTEQVLAVIGNSESLPRREFDEAKRLAEAMRASYQVIVSQEMDDSRYVANPKDRCFYCKSDLFRRITALAREQGYTAVLDGNNADDAGDWRPGRRAACDLGVHSPLLEVGLTKAEIRELSRAFDLPTWDKPAAACLSSRIPYGTAITSEALACVEAAENYLHDLGFVQVRVRHHDTVARIELAPHEMDRLLAPEMRAQITARLREIGYLYVTLDLQGYRLGSLNEVGK